jgi:phytoene dehydrogenase-like protein
MKKVVIIGAGISGLTAGIYALQSGFNVTIYESNPVSGGASTSWKRKGYLFEGGMHWLTGSSPKTPLNRLWREVGALNDTVTVYNRDPFMAFDYNGRTAYLYRDIEKLRRHFLELSPEDAKEINRLCSDIGKFKKVCMPVIDIKGVRVEHKSSLPSSAFFDMLSALSPMLFYFNKTVREYVKRFKSPLLKMVLENIVGPDYSAVALVCTIGTLVSGDGGYPVGGSLAMAGRMTDNFENLGGKIIYNRTVDRVSVQNSVADGISIGNETIPADAVIVTRDMLSAVDTLFSHSIEEPWAKRMRENVIPLLNTFISLGVEADMSGLPERLLFVPGRPFVCGGVSQTVVCLCNYTGYDGYAPSGCTAVTSIIMGDSYDFWKACRENGTYQAEKEKLAKSFIGMLAEKYPQTAGKIAVWDVATPLTYERYLGSYKGSWMSVMGKGLKYESYPSKPKKIRNVYFAGQRLSCPGGLPIALYSGRKAVQYLCRDTDTVFQGAFSALRSRK